MNLSVVAEHRATDSKVVKSGHEQQGSCGPPESGQLEQRAAVGEQEEREAEPQEDAPAEVKERLPADEAEDATADEDDLKTGCSQNTEALPQREPENDDDVTEGTEEETVIGEEQERWSVERKTEEGEVGPGDEIELKREDSDVANQPDDESAKRRENDDRQQTSGEDVQDVQSEDVEQDAEKGQVLQGEGFEVENEDSAAAGRQKDDDKQTQVDKQVGEGEAAATTNEYKKLQDDVTDNSEQSLAA